MTTKKKKTTTNNSAAKLTPDMVTNAFINRRAAMEKLLGARKRNLDAEAGYPSVLTITDYKELWERDGISGRVVSIYPDECWQNDPEVYETENTSEVTKFEKRWLEEVKWHNLYHYLHRADEVSGVGQFGVILLGIDDGKELSEPIDSMNDHGEKAGNAERKLLYVRVFDEEPVMIKSFERDVNNPRFGKPYLYSIQFVEQNSTNGTATIITKDVHWHRIIHVADNRKSSEIFGVPRMKDVFNRLFDLKKILGSSGEMFFRGGFMGLSMEVNPDILKSGAEIDQESIREEFQAYAEGYQRFLAIEGATVKGISPQVADPRPHVDVHLKVISIAKAVPFRVFAGSEQGVLASDQDTRAWNKRVNRRQDKYVTPMLLGPFVERLIACGVLPEPAGGFIVAWPDLNTPSEKEIAEVAAKVADALSTFIQGSVDSIMQVRDFMVHVMKFPDSIVDAILEAKSKEAGDGDEDDDEEEED